MGHEYNEQIFPVHTPSFLHGAMAVGAGSKSLTMGWSETTATNAPV